MSLNVEICALDISLVDLSSPRGASRLVKDTSLTDLEKPLKTPAETPDETPLKTPAETPETPLETLSSQAQPNGTNFIEVGSFLSLNCVEYV